MQFIPKWILLLKNHISKIVLQKVGMNISRLVDDSDWVF
jgi:DNA-binding protein